MGAGDGGHGMHEVFGWIAQHATCNVQRAATLDLQRSLDAEEMSITLRCYNCSVYGYSTRSVSYNCRQLGITDAPHVPCLQILGGQVCAQRYRHHQWAEKLIQESISKV